MAVFDPDDLRERVTFERRVAALEMDSAGTEAWEPVKTIWAEVQDVLPSRGERSAEGLAISNRPARVRTRFHRDLDGAMRIRFGDRLLRIISGPATLGIRDGLEFMAEEQSSVGGG